MPSLFSKLMVPPADTLRDMRGGAAQRHRRMVEAASHRSRSPKRCLATEGHLRAWAVGKSSAGTVWEHVNNNFRMGFRNPAIDRVNGCGRSLDDSNIHRRLCSLIGGIGLDDFIGEVSDGSVHAYIRPVTLMRQFWRGNREKYKVDGGRCD